MTGSLTEIKTAIAWQLREIIGDDRFELWFGSERSISVGNGNILIRGKDDFSLSFVRQQFGTALREVVDAVLGQQIAIEYLVDASPTTPPTQAELFSAQQLDAAGLPPLAKKRRRSRQTAQAGENKVKQDISPNNGSPHLASAAQPPGLGTGKSQYRLDNFQFGDANAVVRSAAQQVLSAPGKFNPFVLHGPVGCGKTHLLHALVAQARRQPNFRHSVYMTSEQFTSSFLEGLNTTGLTSFRAKYRNLDLFAIDDVQFLSGKRATLIEFQNTIDTLLRNGRQIVVACDRPIFELRFLGEELATRLSGGLACELEYPDVEGRMHILQRLLRHQPVSVHRDVLQLIAERIGRDVRLLSGALNRVKAILLAGQTTVTVDDAERLLSDFFQSQHPLVSMAKIERVVCDVCGVEPKDLKSSTRAKKVSTARMLAMWLSRKYTPAALTEIGKYYGGRSHSTVVAAEKKVNKLLAERQQIEISSRRCDIRNAMDRLESSLRVA